MLLLQLLVLFSLFLMLLLLLLRPRGSPIERCEKQEQIEIVNVNVCLCHDTPFAACSFV